MASTSTIGAYQPGVEIGAWQAASDLGSTAGYLPALLLETPEYFIEVLDAPLPVLGVEAVARKSSLWTDPRDGLNPILPDLRIEAQSGERGSLNEFLPDLRVDIHIGIRGDMELPSLEIEATGLTGGRGSLSKILPTFSLEARTGARADMKLPWLAIEADGSAGLGSGTWTLDKKLPALQINAESLTNHINLDASLPVVKIEATGSPSITGQADTNLPGLKITAAASLAIGIDGGPILPDLRIIATAYCPEMTLDANLPALVMAPYASGDGYGGGESTMNNPSRFSGTLLRYDRWAS